MDKRNKTLKATILLTMFLAIEAVLAFTPVGFIMIPPVSITILHIPVIVASVVMGYKYGAVVGFMFGLFSCIRATVSGSPGDMLFSFVISGAPIASIIRCFVPRILLGILPDLINKFLRKIRVGEIISFGISAGISTLVHSFSVLFFMWLFFNSFPLVAVFQTIVGLNCIVEGIAAVIVCAAVCRPLVKMRR